MRTLYTFFLHIVWALSRVKSLPAFIVRNPIGEKCSLRNRFDRFERKGNRLKFLSFANCEYDPNFSDLNSLHPTVLLGLKKSSLKHAMFTYSNSYGFLWFRWIDLLHYKKNGRFYTPKSRWLGGGSVLNT